LRSGKEREQDAGLGVGLTVCSKLLDEGGFLDIGCHGRYVDRVEGRGEGIVQSIRGAKEKNYRSR
jgi:hypothetical protein